MQKYRQRQKQRRNPVLLRTQDHHNLHHPQIQEKLLLCQSKLQRRHRGEKEKATEQVEVHPHIEAATGTTRDVTMETGDGDNFIWPLHRSQCYAYGSAIIAQNRPLIMSDDFWEESEPANSRDSHPNIFLDTMLSETQCIVSWILTAVYISFLCQERAGG